MLHSSETDASPKKKEKYLYSESVQFMRFSSDQGKKLIN